MSNLAHDVAGGGALRGVGDVTEPPVSPPVMGAPDRAPVGAPAGGAAPFGVEELKTLPLQALLVRSGALTIEQLSEALRVNVATGRSVEEIAIERGWVSPDQVAQLVAAKQSVMSEPVAPTPTPAPVAAVEPAPVAPEPVASEPVPPLQPMQPVQDAQPVQPIQPVQELHPAHEVQPVLEMQPAQPVPEVQPVPDVHEAQPIEALRPPEVAPQSEVTFETPAPAPPAAPAPAPVIAPAPAPQPVEAELSIGVFLNLTDGQRVWVGRFANDADAERRAQEVIHAFIRPEPGVWPRFGGRFIRPEAVVSVELSQRRED